MESARSAPSLELRLLGPLQVRRHGVRVPLPPSRKVKALLAYLALAPEPVPRGRLCELLWDVPDDPRGELRWCLSKLRRLVDEADRRRVQVEADSVHLDLADCLVDAIEVVRADRHSAALAALFAGEFLEGLFIDRSPAFDAWLGAQRRRFRDCHAALLDRLVATAPPDEVLTHAERWMAMAPFDQRAHEVLMGTLARRGRTREGAGPATAAPRRGSLAVMPFAAEDARGGVGDALAHDIITRLAKLRSLFVIARGSAFALHGQGLGPQDAGRKLGVDYVVGGSLWRQGKRLVVAVELAEVGSGRIVWAETFDQNLDDAFLVLEGIGDRIVASVAGEIEASECRRAVLRPPSSLDAWDAHHRGLWHAYRFTRADNEEARRFFELAVRLDPTFARAHAGLSFTRFQNAFQGWAAREPEVDAAFAAAGQSLMADDRDPAAHMAMGRALWLRGQHDRSFGELGQAVELSPNFALGHYTLAFVHAQAGDPATAIAAADRSRQLSPFDPLLFGMLGARAMALSRLGRFEEAAECGVQAAARPNAHAHILAIAALTLSLAGRAVEASAHLAAIRRTLPRYRVEDFLAAMRFAPDGEALFREGARRAGMP